MDEQRQNWRIEMQALDLTEDEALDLSSAVAEAACAIYAKRGVDGYASALFPLADRTLVGPL